MQKGLPVYWNPLSLWNRGYLACALAMEALKQYITVKYVRMADFLLECTVTWDEKRYDKVLQAYAGPKLFIIDECTIVSSIPSILSFGLIWRFTLLTV